jgi:hypothetical protein
VRRIGANHYWSRTWNWAGRHCAVTRVTTATNQFADIPGPFRVIVFGIEIEVKNEGVDLANKYW